MATMTMIRNEKLYYLAVAVALIAAVDLSILRWYFPPTEGWWETYAWLMASGERLYADVTVPFPPFQIILTRLQMAIVGPDFLVLRCIGVGTHALAVTAVYLWLSKLTAPIPAFVGVLLCSLYVIYPNGAYIVRDYHTNVELYEAVALFASLYVVGPASAGPATVRGGALPSVALFVCGLSCGILLLLKQNVGVFFSFGLAVALLWNFWDNEQPRRLVGCFRTISIFVFGVVVPLAAVTAYVGSAWLSVYIGNQSKGGVGLVLFRFLTDSLSRRMLFVAVVALFLSSEWRTVRAIAARIENVTGTNLGLQYLSPPVRLAAFLLLKKVMALSMSQTVFAIAIAWAAAQARREKDSGNWLRYGSVPLAMIIYCGTHTAGYNAVSMQLVLAAMIASAVSALGRFFSINRRYVIGLGVAITAAIGGLKLAGPLYEWWGLRQPGAMAANIALPFEELRGLRGGPDTARLYSIAREYKDRLKADDVVFSYPSMPILYLLLNKKPPVSIPVMWFDVSSYSQLGDVINGLRQHQPDVVFWLKPADFVYRGHEELRHQPALIDGVDRWLYSEIRAGHYVVEEMVQFEVDDSWLATDPYASNPQVVKTLVTRSDLTCRNLRQIEGVEDVVAMACGTPEQKIEPGAIITVTFENARWRRELLEEIGVPVATDDAHVFMALRRRANGDRMKKWPLSISEE